MPRLSPTSLAQRPSKPAVAGILIGVLPAVSTASTGPAADSLLLDVLREVRRNPSPDKKSAYFSNATTPSQDDQTPSEERLSDVVPVCLARTDPRAHTLTFGRTSKPSPRSNRGQTK
jgi:hypothetical protein